MRLYSDTALRNFEFWSGAKDTIEDLTPEEIDTIESMLADAYPEGMSDTEVNDFFWFERDLIAEWLGYDSYEGMLKVKNNVDIDDWRDYDFDSKVADIINNAPNPDELWNVVNENFADYTNLAGAEVYLDLDFKDDVSQAANYYKDDGTHEISIENLKYLLDKNQLDVDLIEDEDVNEALGF